MDRGSKNLSLGTRREIETRLKITAFGGIYMRPPSFVSSELYKFYEHASSTRRDITSDNCFRFDTERAFYCVTACLLSSRAMFVNHLSFDREDGAIVDQSTTEKTLRDVDCVPRGVGRWGICKIYGPVRFQQTVLNHLDGDLMLVSND